MEFTREYIVGLTLNNFYARKYKWTVTGPPLDGCVFYSEVVTPREDGRPSGDGEIKFYIKEDGPEFDCKTKLINYLIKNPQEWKK